jgi:hypothetical protein
MDLKEGWEEKALIGVGIIVLIIIVYAYFVPFSGTPDNNTSYNQVVPAQVIPVPYSQPTVNNSTSNNSTSTNASFKLTSDQAKNIALNANQGYTAGTITQGNIIINGTNYPVWIVAISQTNAPSKTVFVDDDSGKILQTT